MFYGVAIWRMKWDITLLKNLLFCINSIVWMTIKTFLTNCRFNQAKIYNEVHVASLFNE